ncbi:MAG: hypothetical protein AAF728_10260 [Cyanobacteria bacterium P01_D01_bin.128]
MDSIQLPSRIGPTAAHACIKHAAVEAIMEACTNHRQKTPTQRIKEAHQRVKPKRKPRERH